MNWNSVRFHETHCSLDSTHRWGLNSKMKNLEVFYAASLRETKKTILQVFPSSYIYDKSLRGTAPPPSPLKRCQRWTVSSPRPWSGARGALSSPLAPEAVLEGHCPLPSPLKRCKWGTTPPLAPEAVLEGPCLPPSPLKRCKWGTVPLPSTLKRC